MSDISGFISYSHNFTNNNVNEQSAENASEKLKGAIVLSSEEQGEILSGFLAGFNGFSEMKGAGDVDYFARTDENGNTHCLKVVEIDGKNMIVSTTIEAGTGVGQTEVYDVNVTQNLQDWNSTETLNKYYEGEPIPEFKMIDISETDLNLKTEEYTTELEAYAQDFINIYDEDGNGVWSYNEFSKMALDGLDTEGADLQPVYDLQTQLFNDFQMDSYADSISSKEFASQLMMGDIDWASISDDVNIMDVVDGNLNYYNYNTMASDPSDTQYYESDLANRQFLYDNYFA